MTKISLHQKNKQISGSKRKAWLVPALKALWKVVSYGLGFYTAASVVKKIATTDEDDEKGLLINQDFCSADFYLSGPLLGLTIGGVIF